MQAHSCAEVLDCEYSVAYGRQTMITPAEVRQLLDTSGLTQGQLAERLGVSQPTVSRWLRGAVPDHQQESAIRAFMATDAPNLWLMPGTPPQVVTDGFREAPNAPEIDKGAYPRNVPVRGIAVGGEDADFTMNGETGDFVRRPPGLEGKRGVYALHVNGESMWPAHRHGALVYVDSNRLPGAGDDAVIELHPEKPQTGEPGRGFLKRVKRIGPSKILVEQFNPPREIEFTRAEIKSFHRVIPWEEVVGY